MANKGTTLSTNGYLSAGDYIQSPNGRYRAIMQADGNFVLYQGNTALWASNTVQATGDYFVIMQDDGNLVLYTGTRDKAGTALWASNTAQGTGSYVLALGNDGNLVAYQDIVAWQTNTANVAQQMPVLPGPEIRDHRTPPVQPGWPPQRPPVQPGRPGTRPPMTTTPPTKPPVPRPKPPVPKP